MNKKESKPKSKNRRFIMIIISLVVALALVQLVISHRLATAGEKVKKLEVLASQIEQKNTVLEEEINHFGSLLVISQKAKALGFNETKKILYLTPQFSVALSETNSFSKIP